MSPTENAQLTEPDTVSLNRYDGPDAVDDGTGPLTLAPRIEESQRLREHFRALVDDPENLEDLDDLDDLEGERVRQARRVVVLMVALALLAVTVGITLIGLGGTDQRRPETSTDVAAAAAAARADAGRSQVTAVPAAPTAAPASSPTASPTATASATASPSAPSPSVSPSATATPSASIGRSPSPSASSAKPAPAPKPPAPSPSASRPKPAGPACTVSAGAQAQLVGYRATATVTNKGGKALDGWTVTFSLPRGYLVQTLSGGVWNQSGSTVSVMNGSRLAPGASATLNFNGWGGFGPPDAGSGYTLSGTSCR